MLFFQIKSFSNIKHSVKSLNQSLISFWLKKECFIFWKTKSNAILSFVKFTVSKQYNSLKYNRFFIIKENLKMQSEMADGYVYANFYVILRTTKSER